MNLYGRKCYVVAVVVVGDVLVIYILFIPCKYLFIFFSFFTLLVRMKDASAVIGIGEKKNLFIVSFNDKGKTV